MLIFHSLGKKTVIEKDEITLNYLMRSKDFPDITTESLREPLLTLTESKSSNRGALNGSFYNGSFNGTLISHKATLGGTTTPKTMSASSKDHYFENADICILLSICLFTDKRVLYERKLQEALASVTSKQHYEVDDRVLKTFYPSNINSSNVFEVQKLGMFVYEAALIDHDSVISLSSYIEKLEKIIPSLVYIKNKNTKHLVPNKQLITVFHESIKIYCILTR